MRYRASEFFAVLLLGLAMTGAAGRSAAAENLIVSVSNHRITVTPNYSGEELVLFGSIERDSKSRPPDTAYDIVVTVSGPRADMVTRRKERKLGIWLNVDSREFIQVPAYLGIFANRTIDSIASPDVQRRQQIGITRYPLPQRMGPDIANTVASDPFRTAFVRLRTDEGLYREQPGALTFLTPTLFRTGIPLPAEVPTGTYTIDIKLFADGVALARTETAFEIVKVGFEQFVANSARHYGLLYGLATAMMAIMTGWLASVIFRRD